MLQLWPEASSLLVQLWDLRATRVLLAITALELALVGVQIGALLLLLARKRRRTRTRGRLAASLGPSLLEAARAPERRPRWLSHARAWPRDLVRELLSEHLLRAEGAYLDELRATYRALGFLEEDMDQLRSGSVLRRLLAVRHLHRVAGPSEAHALLATRGDHHAVRIVAAQALARVGEPAHTLEMLEDLELPSRLMEQPVGSALRAMAPAQLDLLVTRWFALRSPAVRRLVLAQAARSLPHRAAELLECAAGSPLEEDRIGATIAAGSLPPRVGVPWLVELLSDPSWRVRAQAARALGESADPFAAAPLGTALDDRAFWVRHNAQQALGRLEGPAEELA